MTTRVHMGRLDAITGGVDQFGLYVTGPDGTAIIDGTSNMFKIAATGVLSNVMSGSSYTQTSILLPGLGTLSEPPGFMGFIGPPGAVGGGMSQFELTSTTAEFMAATSGGAVTLPAVGFQLFSIIWTELSGGIASIFLGGMNATAGSFTREARFYVLQETAI